MNFNELNLSPEVVELLAARNITIASPIQIQSLPFTMSGQDLIGRARTGTGKTLAFALPIIEKMQPSRERGRAPRAIILAPTRELAKQVAGEFEATAPNLRVVTVYGGAPYSPQERSLMGGVDIVVGTPGRLIDHLDRGNLDLSKIEFAVLDEADEMLNVGFLEPVERILADTPAERQTLFFSATLTREVLSLARRLLKNPKLVDLVGEESGKTSQTVEHLAVKVGKSRTRVLCDLLTVYNPEKAIVFTRTKREVDELALELIGRGLEAEGLHGDMAQSQRERALASFRSGMVRVLVATDVAARGLDIAEVDLVVQYHMPQDTEAYIHRSGRTGRAGRSGRALVLFGDREMRGLRNLEHATGVQFIRRDAPKSHEVVEALVDTTGNLVRKVKAELATPFMDQAQALFEEMGVEALARALARIAGATEPVRNVSLLSGEEDMTTVQLDAPRLGIPKAVALICRTLDLDAKLLGRVRLFNGGAVADIPTRHIEKLMAASPLEEQVVLSLPQDLPDLIDAPDRRDDRGGRSSGGRYAGGGGDRYQDRPRHAQGDRGGDRGGRPSFRDSNRSGSYNRDRS